MFYVVYEKRWKSDWKLYLLIVVKISNWLKLKANGWLLSLIISFFKNGDDELINYLKNSMCFIPKGKLTEYPESTYNISTSLPMIVEDPNHEEVEDRWRSWKMIKHLELLYLLLLLKQLFNWSKWISTHDWVFLKL